MKISTGAFITHLVWKQPLQLHIKYKNQLYQCICYLRTHTLRVPFAHIFEQVDISMK